MVSALVAAAVSVAALHALAPDHWVPFAALARTERWSTTRTAVVTALCGAGHVTASVIIGILGAAFGIGLFEAFGTALEGVAPYVLIGFGLAYATWGAGRMVRKRWHRRMHARGEHHHHHAHHHLDHHALSARALFLLFCADPCVAVIPLMFAALSAGWTAALAVVAAYEAATIATMVALVLPARAASAVVRAAWVDRYSDVMAGVVIAAVGLLVGMVGI
jgi:hypothetical protein